MGAEGARLEIDQKGAVSVFVGSPSQGQGHATAFAQVAADRLGVVPELIRVTSGDTRGFASGFGTVASRMGLYGGNAVSLAAQGPRQKVLTLAADLLEIS